MSKYFSRFPKVFYSLDTDHANPQVVRDVTFPVRILEPYARDARFFYTIIVKDGLKPEDVAYLVYGDVELHWVVLQFNKIIDPRFQWSMSSINFDNYIKEKYGSIANAQSGIKTYYRLTTTQTSLSDTQNTTQIEINQDEYNAIVPDFGGTQYQLVNGEVLTIFLDKATLSYYDWELGMNEARREIRLIQKEYIEQIRKSFYDLTTPYN